MDGDLRRDEAHSVLVCWRHSHRSAGIFVRNLGRRLKGRVQITTDGNRAYLSANKSLPDDLEVDYAMPIKHYGPAPDKDERRCSPAEYVGTSVETIQGGPECEHVNTSYVERANLTLRMGCRRFTRLTNAFSMKVENHAWAVSLHLMHYNFARIHKALRITPAMPLALRITSGRWRRLLLEPAGRAGKARSRSPSPAGMSRSVAVPAFFNKLLILLYFLDGSDIPPQWWLQANHQAVR